MHTVLTVFPPLQTATALFPKIHTVLTVFSPLRTETAMLPGIHTVPTVSPRVRPTMAEFSRIHTAQAEFPLLLQEIVSQQRRHQVCKRLLKLLLCRVVSTILSTRSGLVRTPTSSRTLALRWSPEKSLQFPQD